MFLYKTDKQKYRKYIKDMENYVLHKKYPLPKTVNDVCHVLAGWWNQYNSKYNRFFEVNNGIAYAMTKNKNTKRGKGKKVTCYKCKQDGHYSNKCPQEEDKLEKMSHNNKKGTSFIAKTQSNDGPDDSYKEAEDISDNKGFAFLQHDIVCSIQEEVAIPKTRILLDSQSTVNVFSNPSLLYTFVMQKRTLFCTAMLVRQLSVRRVTSRAMALRGSTQLVS